MSKVSSGECGKGTGPAAACVACRFGAFAKAGAASGAGSVTGSGRSAVRRHGFNAVAARFSVRGHS